MSSSTIRKSNRQRGFTLLEIMLVIAIAAMTAAVVLPNMFRADSEKLHDEARLLHQRLRLAASEAQLTGVPMRLSLWSDHYQFDTLATDGSWLASNEEPFAPASFEGYQISDVQQQGGEKILQKLREPSAGTTTAPATAPATSDTEQKPVTPPLARVLLFPDGMLTLVDINLQDQANNSETIEVRPGPGGIRIKTADEKPHA